MKDFKNMIVIGASAGGIAAMHKVLAGLSDQLDAVVLVVLHLGRQSNAKIIASGFQKHTTLICTVATDQAELRKGYLYLAPADHHMMVVGDKIRVNQGPHENRYRPSIDVLFRSAAVYFKSQVIAVVLTGMLDDGTSGMFAVQRCGGVCIVQDPKDSEYADMPTSVLNVMQVDHKASLREIPDVIDEVTQQPLPESRPVPVELKTEAELTERMMSGINQLKDIADRSDFVCPDCGGGLWAVKNDPNHRYRCYTGHVYTERMLYDEQAVRLEESIWVSLRMMEERRNMLLLMGTHADQKGNHEIDLANQDRAAHLNDHIKRLKEFLSKLTADLGQNGAA